MPKISPEFVWRMEDVLDLYAQPVDEKRPLVCFDERLCQLIADIEPVLPMKPKRGEKPGQPSRYDYEYERQGSCNLESLFRSLLGMETYEGNTASDKGRLCPVYERISRYLFS